MAEIRCRRELLEEAGLGSRRVVHLGTHFAEVGRLENRHHAYFVEAGDPDPAFVPEEGLGVRFVAMAELEDMIRDGSFAHPLHLAIVLLFKLRSEQP